MRDFRLTSYGDDEGPLVRDPPDAGGDEAEWKRRFVECMVSRACGSLMTAAERAGVEEYARDAAEGHWIERAYDGPEECVDADMEDWEPV